MQEYSISDIAFIKNSRDRVRIVEVKQDERGYYYYVIPVDLTPNRLLLCRQSELTRDKPGFVITNDIATRELKKHKLHLLEANINDKILLQSIDIALELLE